MPTVTGYPPGTIIVPLGDTTRFSDFWRDAWSLKIPHGTRTVPVIGSNVARNQNLALRKRNHERKILGEWVWFSGDDHTFSPDIILRLLDHNVDVVAPLVYKRKPPFSPVVYKGPNPDDPRFLVPYQRRELPSSGLFPVYACSTQAMLIRERVLEKLADPWFELGKTGAGTDAQGEDLYLCRKITEAGFQIYLDCNLQNVQGHITPMIVRPAQDDHGRWIVEIDADGRVYKLPNEVGPGENEHEDAPALIAMFDDWRDRYDAMTYAEHQQIAVTMEQMFPIQQHANRVAVAAFLAETPGDLRVLELGGWKGELAATMLAQMDRIKSWRNYDLCPSLAEKQVCSDVRYRLVIPEDWFWNLQGPVRHNVFIATHVIEHLSVEHFAALAHTLGAIESIKAVHFEVPLPEDETNHSWQGYMGTHILPLGWKQVEQIMGNVGFQTVKRFKDIRWFRR